MNKYSQYRTFTKHYSNQMIFVKFIYVYNFFFVEKKMGKKHFNYKKLLKNKIQ